MTNSVVVTGAAGFVGSHLVRSLVHQGRHVVATDLEPALPTPVLTGLDASKMSYISGDLRDDATLTALIEQAGAHTDVIHVAAMNRFAELAQALGEKAPTPAAALEVFEVNAMGTWRLCSRFAAASCLGRFVYISTRSVFGGLEGSGKSILETSPQRPISIYGSSKTAAEVGALAFRDAFGLDLAIARITGVFGPWQGTVSWIGKAVNAVNRGEPYRAERGSNDMFELTYVKDTIRGLVDLVSAERLSHSIYHLSSGSMHSLSDVADAFRAADPDAVVEFGPGSQVGMRPRTRLDGANAIEELGFSPRWDLHSAISDYLSIERSGLYGSEVVVTD